MAEQDDVAITKAILLGYKLDDFSDDMDKFAVKKFPRWAVRRPNGHYMQRTEVDPLKDRNTWYWWTAEEAAAAVLKDAGVLDAKNP